VSFPVKGIAIVGGGIGGVATAVALEQAGIHATVYERAPELREVGAGVILWPNATRVLRELGVLDRVAARSAASDNFLVRSSSGKILMDLALGDFEVPALCARRADLLAALVASLPSDRIRLGHELTHLGLIPGDRSNSKVCLRFSISTPGRCDAQPVEHCIEHNAVIGADGLRSRVRAELFGLSEPTYRGYTVWRGIANFAGSALPRGSSETWGSGKRFGIWNTGQDRFTWYGTVNVSRDHRDTPAGRKQDLLEAFAGWHDPIPALIRATDESSIVKNGAFDREPLRRWTRGPITLLGDAAHPCTPNLGQGCCMALEDALVLAKCISGARSIASAFERYESLRRPRTSHLQRRSRMMGQIGQWDNRMLVAGRKTITSLLPAMLFEYNLRRVYSYET
jgi:2-polyprenyl-6-methoxyphenol hydroxylase-like FAD-dependent oxidoreductase